MIEPSPQATCRNHVGTASLADSRPRTGHNLPPYGWFRYASFARYSTTGAEERLNHRGGKPRLEAELAELFGVALPFLEHLDVQVEVNAGSEQLVDLQPGRRTDLFQPAATLPDDDALL